MRDALVMWRNTKMAVLAALCAAVYAALIIPLKAIPIIPGFTELRPAIVVPIVGGLLFGPAAAWGCAFGTVLADFFGSIGPGSFFGFVGNFAFAYVAFRLWRILGRGRPATGAPREAALFVVVTVLSSMCCAVVIGWGVDLLGMVPYQVLTGVITLNNSIGGVILGLILLPLMYVRARRWGLLYDVVMPPEDYAESRLAPLGALLVAAGALVGAAVALNMYLGGDKGPLVALLPPGFPLQLLSTMCVAAILVGSGMFAGVSSGRRVHGSAPHAAAASRGHGSTRVEEDRDLEPVEGAPALETEGLGFRYALSDEPALKAVSLRQMRGHLRVVMGRTAAGKSTLCKLLTGVAPALEVGEVQGRVRLMGCDLRGVPVYRLARWVGAVSQDFESQLVTSGVQAEVAFPLENLGVSRDEMKRRVTEALQQVGLWHLRDRDPVSLSGGEKQRLALATALVSEPPILVLDEPTTDLDPGGKEDLLAVCTGLRSAGRTLVVTEHETQVAAEADVLTVLQGGTVVFDGPPEELLRYPGRTEKLGMRPLDMPALFEMLGRDERPLTVADAAALLKDAPFDEDAWESQRWSGPPTFIRRAESGRPPLISLREVEHRYPDGTAALQGLNLDIYEGEFVAIIGANGSGKSTLAQHLNGLLLPTAGEVTVGGVDTRRTSPAKLAGTVGYLFQDPDKQIFTDRVVDEVSFGPRNTGLDPERTAERVERALVLLNLEEMRDADPFLLTKGLRQKVAMASVLAMQPRAVVFDEPTTGLDGVLQARMMERLRVLNDMGRTVVMITHVPWAVAEYAERVVVLDAGRIIADGATRDVLGDAEVMAQARQRLPQVTELCHALWGRTVLSVAEAAFCLNGGDEQ
jgi:energy-coupling factor transporter ATP-binding protein EcfA2